MSPQELFFEQELSVRQDGCVPQDEDLEQEAEAALLQEKTEVSSVVRTRWPQRFRALALETAHRV